MERLIGGHAHAARPGFALTHNGGVQGVDQSTKWRRVWSLDRLVRHYSNRPQPRSDSAEVVGCGRGHMHIVATVVGRAQASPELPLDVEFTHAGLERGTPQSKTGRSPTRPPDFSTTQAQRFENSLAFGILVLWRCRA